MNHAGCSQLNFSRAGRKESAGASGPPRLIIPTCKHILKSGAFRQAAAVGGRAYSALIWWSGSATARWRERAAGPASSSWGSCAACKEFRLAWSRCRSRWRLATSTRAALVSSAGVCAWSQAISASRTSGYRPNQSMPFLRRMGRVEPHSRGATERTGLARKPKQLYRIPITTGSSINYLRNGL